MQQIKEIDLEIAADSEDSVAKQAAARPPYKPAANETPTTTGSASAQTQTALVSGAAPVLQSNSFDSRFAGFK